MNSKMNNLMRRFGIYIILVVLMIAGALLNPVFLTPKNLLSVLRQLSIIGVLAFAEMVLIISGNIDLSLGSVVALSGMISVNVYLSTGSYVLTFVAAIVVALLVCTSSGFLVAKLKLPAFIATLAMNYIARGLCYIYTNGQPIYDIGDYGKISSGFLGPIPIPIIFLVAVAFICWLIISRTTLGRDIYAIGGNSSAANASGISVPRTIIKSFMIAGIFTGIAAVLQFARVNSGLPDTATGYDGDAIAAAVVGGTSFTGGVGTVPGVFAGALIMGMISNILNLAGVQSYVQMVVKGLIIILALSIDMASKNRKIKLKTKNT